MSATLYREGDDLDELLAELDGQHPGQVRVVSVTYPREGGVFGFFARQRVGVHFTLTSDVVETSLDYAPPVAGVQSFVLDDLIAAAEAGDGSTAVPAVTVPDETPAANAEFAQMLLELAARKSAVRAQGGTPVAPTHVPAPMPTPAAAAPMPTPAAAAPMSAPMSAPISAPRDDARTPLTLRRQLAELGVPIHWVPADSANAYHVIEDLVTQLPPAPAPPSGAGDILVIAGPSAPALRAAENIRARLHLREENVWTAGCTPTAGIPLDDSPVIVDPWHAATVSAEVRLAGRGPTIVVVCTDDLSSDEHAHTAWASDVVRALNATAVWGVVDATRKPGDTRAELDRLGDVCALVVVNAARTASPASAWELELPVALLDGRPATRGSWAVLLIDKLAAQEL